MERCHGRRVCALPYIVRHDPKLRHGLRPVCRPPSVRVPEVLLRMLRHEVCGGVRLKVAREPRAAAVMSGRRTAHGAHASHTAHAAHTATEIYTPSLIIRLVYINLSHRHLWIKGVLLLCNE